MFRSVPRVLVSIETDDPVGRESYIAAVRAAGGEPVIRYASAVDPDFDGLLLTGGGDVDPAFYRQPLDGSGPSDPVRDEAELALARAYLAAGKPVFGICRGHQVLNVALGGTLVQDLGEELNAVHRKSLDNKDGHHLVRAEPGSILYDLYGTGKGLVITARAEHGVIEGIELPGRPVLGVQFHPERMTGRWARDGLASGAAVFDWFIGQCRRTP